MGMRVNKMSEEIFVYIEVFPDLSFHLHLDDEEYYGLTDYDEIKKIVGKKMAVVVNSGK